MCSASPAIDPSSDGSPSRRVAPDRAAAFLVKVLRAEGLPPGDAALLADSLIEADLWGHQSHGVMRVPWYVSRIRSGAMSATTAVELIVDSGALAVIDGHDGVGQVLAARAAQEAILRAKVHGVGAVGVRNSNHFGTAAYFTRMAAAEQCVGVLTTNASPAMAPWGGRDKRLGTNPWSIAAPAGRYGTVVLDVANTAVARGKIYLARQQGAEIPDTWAIDEDGQPTTDPSKALEGLILPMAGHKGYAISLMMDVLSGVLTGSSFGLSVVGPYDPVNRSGCGHLFLALNIEAFQPPNEFATRMEELIEQIKATPPAAGFSDVYFPGELEARNRALNLRHGLALPAQTITDLEELARAGGVELDDDLEPMSGPVADLS